jgi:sortase A
VNRARALAILEFALWTVAVVCLGWTSWAWGDARWYQATQAGHVVGLDAAGTSPAVAVGGRPILRDGTPLARLSIPRLDLAVVVAEGTTSGVLRRAVGHLAGSALPGEDGNLVLAGHRDTFLRPLRQVEVGDRVVVERDRGVDVYTVTWTRVVDPRDVEVTQVTGYPSLTLLTCYPFGYVGPAPKRFVVRALLTERIL